MLFIIKVYFNLHLLLGNCKSTMRHERLGQWLLLPNKTDVAQSWSVVAYRKGLKQDTNTTNWNTSTCICVCICLCV